jgi:hypothetical protein
MVPLGRRLRMKDSLRQRVLAVVSSRVASIGNCLIVSGWNRRRLTVEIHPARKLQPFPNESGKSLGKEEEWLYAPIEDYGHRQHADRGAGGQAAGGPQALGAS